MLSAITGKGSSRFAFYLTLQLASVLAPGIVTGTEVVFLALAGQGAGKAHANLASFLRALSALRGPTMVFAFILGVAACYVIGYVCRELAFRFLGLAERTLRRTPSEPALTTIARIVGEETVAGCAEFHPVVGALTRAASAADQALDVKGPVRVGGAHRWDVDFEVRAYATLWLRRFSPTLAVDQTEAEINILVSSLMPLMLAVPATAAWSGSPGLALVIGLPLAAFTCFILLTSTSRLRETEHWEGIRNLFSDHSMRIAAARYDAVAATEATAAPSSGPGQASASAVPDPDAADAG